MSKKLQFIALSFFICIFSPYAESSDFLPKKLLIRKGTQWLRQNLSLRSPRKKTHQKSVFEKEELFLKVLEVIAEEKPFATNAYNTFHSLIQFEKELSNKYRDELVALIDFVEMSDESKVKLIDMLDNKVESNIFNETILIRKSLPISQVLKGIQNSIKEYRLPRKLKNKLKGSFETVEELMLGHLKPGDCYDTNTSCQFTGNLGLIRYYSNEVEENHLLALAVLKASIRIQHLNKEFDLTIAPQFDDKYDFNLWPILVDVSNGDKALALEVLSVYGHDNIAKLSSSFAKDKFLINVLQSNRPTQYGDDKNPKSSYFFPGSLAGVMPRKKVIRKLNKAKRFYEKVHETKLSIRSGYYHVFGGALIAQEIHKRGFGHIYGIDIAGFLSHAMGYMYKKTQLSRYLTRDAQILYERAKGNEYKIRSLTRQDWDKKRFLKALANLKLHLALLSYTEEQHRVGARFALKVYKNL